MPIHILADDVVSKIAAGEVVERPASVVKELLENALDAGARHISVRVEGAGQRLIEVADDGSGIPEGQMELAVRRHATSKLDRAEDLFSIRTLGFRGEALASIASVSRFTLTSCLEGHPVGTRLAVDGGSPGRAEKTGAPAGTVVRVEDLFFNMPARLKFLKKDSTERQQIDGLVTRYALAYPAVRMELTHDGKPALQTSGKGDRRETLASLYGVETAKQMLEVVMEEEGLRLTGYTSPLALTRSNRREITFFINGRWVQDTPLTNALLQAYHNFLMVGRYPMAVLFLEVPADEVDVNVHPAKAEVRFRSQDKYFSGVQRGVRRALLAYSPLPQVSAGGWQMRMPAGEPPSPFAQSGGNFQPRYGVDPGWQLAGQFNRDGSADEPQPGGAENMETLPETGSEPAVGMIPILRLVGQIGNTYIAAEGPDGLYLVDQHAAHERVLFEKYLKKRPGSVPSQALLQGVDFQLAPQAAQLFNEQIPLLNELGFAVEPFGPSAFRVSALPAFLAGSDPAAAVRSVVEDFEEDETPLKGEQEKRLIARICKRVAVKGGQSLSTAEQAALLRDLEACASPRTCPHGRPTMIHLSVDLLERQFGRRGAR
jgi:DNA mismatch repair protein MutL